MSGLRAHLAGGATTTCYCWAVARRDGVVLGFTDHDRDLSFEGVVFRADTGLTAGALQHLSGLAVDNAESIRFGRQPICPAAWRGCSKNPW